MDLKESDITNIAVILNTWLGFHNTRRKIRGMSISHCYILLACVWLERLGRPISEGSIRGQLKMYHPTYLSKLMSLLLLQEFIVLTRTEGRKRYYQLTDKGRSISAELINGIDERMVAWYNKNQLHL
jgi:hypothetical protein